jgi:hypothetical protein
MADGQFRVSGFSFHVLRRSTQARLANEQRQRKKPET